MGYKWDGKRYVKGSAVKGTPASDVSPVTEKPAQPKADNPQPTPETTPSGSGNQGQALTLGSLRKMNKDALENLAKKRGVDISSATNNQQRAEIIFADIQAKQ